MSNLSSALAYYTAQGVMTDPDRYAYLFDGLPNDISSLTGVVQGLLIHPFTTGLYDVELTRIQKKEVNIRPVREMLKLIQTLDDRPLTITRPANERVVGNCRDHAVLFCAMLRHQGIPARVRVGFAAYLGSDLYYDHWRLAGAGIPVALCQHGGGLWHSPIARS